MSDETSQEDVLARHRKERKDLTNHMTSLRKQASKKTRKQVNAKCIELEQELETRHKSELAQLNGESVGITDAEELTPDQLLAEMSLNNDSKSSPAEADESGQQHHQQQQLEQNGKKRRNRQKEKLAKRDAEIAKIKEQALEEAAEQPNLKEIEQNSLDKVCEVLHLEQFDIQPDGHCLFSSILDQVKLRHQGENSVVSDYHFPTEYTGTKSVTEMDIYSLRSLSSSYIRENRDDFIPYLFDENTMTVKDVDEYTKTMESTAQWGGEVEILALSKVLDCTISILMSGRSTYKINEAGKNPELKLVYYKHSYTLGEHYNSLHDL
ncbi:unnamed protein product [Kluyveromyces dobzhanskii CBS 2104]|uniref:WGS project CCBQ000000000 data, contig 00058 n=1 Tax=Kluyveromyces dobzhanskii CBS 2104 TaxID=1427455 RepID=A0A0A8LDR0_9SACH|nr:unnamed protein product [Kluyveromyces dobzhanskii CBS 2104]